MEKGEERGIPSNQVLKLASQGNTGMQRDFRNATQARRSQFTPHAVQLMSDAFLIATYWSRSFLMVGVGSSAQAS